MMNNQDSIFTVVFTQPSDPIPEPVSPETMFQVWLTTDLNESSAEIAREKLPRLTLDLSGDNLA